MKMLLTFFAILGFATHTLATELRTEIHINATAEAVWSVLTDFESYPDWNPFIIELEGDVKEGNRIHVRISPPNSRTMDFKPEVLEFEENKSFRWKGKLWIRGIFDGEHIFELLEHEDGSTTLVHREIFGGILVPFFRKQLFTNTREGFILMNEGIKERAENLN